MGRRTRKLTDLYNPVVFAGLVLCKCDLSKQFNKKTRKDITAQLAIPSSVFSKLHYGESVDVETYLRLCEWLADENLTHPKEQKQ